MLVNLGALLISMRVFGVDHDGSVETGQRVIEIVFRHVTQAAPDQRFGVIWLATDRFAEVPDGAVDLVLLIIKMTAIVIGRARVRIVTERFRKVDNRFFAFALLLKRKTPPDVLVSNYSSLSVAAPGRRSARLSIV